jgi:hypothetical protein
MREKMLYVHWVDTGRSTDLLVGSLCLCSAQTISTEHIEAVVHMLCAENAWTRMSKLAG